MPDPICHVCAGPIVGMEVDEGAVATCAACQKSYADGLKEITRQFRTKRPVRVFASKEAKLDWLREGLR